MRYIHIYRYHITIYTYIQVYASYLMAALDGEDNENCGLGARSQHTHTHTRDFEEGAAISDVHQDIHT